jgi:hypothetical protein
MRGKIVVKFDQSIYSKDHSGRVVCLSLPEGRIHVFLEKHRQGHNGNIHSISSCPNGRRWRGCFSWTGIRFLPSEIAHIRELIQKDASPHISKIQAHWG